MKILLVEDHASLAQVSCRLLREVHEHEVEHVISAPAALEALPRFQPDLMLVDIHLPQMTGYELAQQVRAQPEYDATVLVALTGFGNIDAESARTVGFDAHFRKPMDFALLPTLRRITAAGFGEA